MGDPITRQQAEDAALDAESIAAFATGPDDPGTFTDRLGRTHKTMAKLEILGEEASAEAQNYAAALTATSSSLLTIGTSVKALVIEEDKQFQPGQRVRIAADTANTMDGTVSSYSGTALTVAVDGVTGSGTFSDWTVMLSGAKGDAGDGASVGDFGMTGKRVAAAETASDLYAAAPLLLLTDLGDLAADAVLLAQKADGSIGRTTLGSVRAVGNYLRPETISLLSKWDSAGGLTRPDRTRIELIDDFFIAMQNYKAHIVACSIFAAHTPGAILYDWFTPSRACLMLGSSGGPTVATDRGITSNGSDQYVNLNVPSVNPPPATQNSEGLWVSVNDNHLLTVGAMGQIGRSETYLFPRYTGDVMRANINASAGDSVSLGVATSVGISTVIRRDANTVRFYKDGAQIGSDVTRASSGAGAANICVCRANNAPYYTGQISAALVTDFMDDAAVAAVRTALYNFLHAIGAL